MLFIPEEAEENSSDTLLVVFQTEQLTGCPLICKRMQIKTEIFSYFNL